MCELTYFGQPSVPVSSRASRNHTKEAMFDLRHPAVGENTLSPHALQRIAEMLSFPDPAT